MAARTSQSTLQHSRCIDANQVWVHLHNKAGLNFIKSSQSTDYIHQNVIPVMKLKVDTYIGTYVRQLHSRDQDTSIQISGKIQMK